MTTKTTLAACPVCGRADAKLHCHKSYHSGKVSGFRKTFKHFYVKCRRRSCVKKNPVIFKQTTEAAIKAWNGELRHAA